jgi:DNA invertase Pin-like site-specific DNA recombinase
VLNVLTSVSAWEREIIGERTSAALQHKARNGEFTGGRMPYGWKLGSDGRRLEVEPAEVPILERARELRAAGKSLRGIAGELEAQGFKSREGKRFGPSSVLRLLRAS